jgi:ribosomal protein S18 acetylase RimI-like enzyme
MNIRRATLSDAAALAEIAERTFRDTFAPHNTPADLEAYVASAYSEEKQRRELESGNIVLLGETDDGQLIAYTQMRRVQSPYGEIEILRFYVDRNHHGRGIAFYVKCGYRDVGSQPFLVGSDLQTDRVMARVIPPS